MRASEFIDQLHAVRPNGSGWKARCPGHDDREASLSIHEGDDNRVLLKCFAGCDTADIVDALGLAMRDLFPERPESSNGHKPPRWIVETYPYYDETGELLYEAVRYEPKDFKQRRPDGRGGWVWNLQGVRRVLYRLPQLQAALEENPTRWVLITEGEKDVDRLWSLGFVATTCPQGAEKWREEYSETLRGRHVAIIPDNDDPGRRHARQVAHSLHGIAIEIKVIDLPGLPVKGDVSDWMDAGGTKLGLQRLVLAAPKWAPDAELEPEIEDEDPEFTIPAASHWPVPPKPEAFYGLAGEIVRALEPETEADSAGLLLNFLTGFGNIVGARPHYRVGGSRHCLRINVIQVGETSGGRKGTGWSALKPIFAIAAPDWLRWNVKSGLSSGEGLIWAVRDEIKKSEPVKDKGRIVAYEDVVTDPGVVDKRLLVTEEEFASTLRVMGRDASTLSAVIRKAWDDGDLRTLTKNSPATATGAHISILGHITKDELLRYLDSTEAGNGFANRFLFACVKRSKLLPDGGKFDDDKLAMLGYQLAEVIEVASKIDLITRDEDARRAWAKVYGPLSEGRVGLMGAVLARAEAQVMRLAAIYAALDGLSTVTIHHLRAALALWEYIEASTKYIFGDALGDPVADSILQALRQSGELTRTDIRDLFGRNLSAGKIDRALSSLLTAGKARREKQPSGDRGGRPTEVWKPC